MTFYDPKAVEAEVQAHWKAHRIPEKITALKPATKTFFLLDGPPYVNYVPHVGHVMTTTFKDAWSKFKQMQGFSVWWQPGFDCSGLPIENAVEKKLGITSKRDIETLGVGKFIAECKALAEKNRPLWMDTYRRLGAWRGWVEPYMTYRNDYLESGWWTVRQLHDKGLLAEGEKPGFWCTHCETVLAGYETSDSYKQVEDPSIVVKFPLQEGKRSLLVWTTTPWTLPSNVAIAVHPGEAYAEVEAGGERLILAEKRLQLLTDLGMGCKVVKKMTGKQLAGLKYRGVVDTPLQREMDAAFHRVILSIKLLKKRAASKVGEGDDVVEDFVTMDTGTGFVHTAPGLGDHKVGEHYRLPFLSPVDDRGRFTEGAGKYQGLHVKEADTAIIADLKQSGLLLHAGTVRHAYPLCWRCKTPLIYRMSRQWFVKTSTLVANALAADAQVRWLPDFGRERFRDVLTTAPDWAVTRQRYWGIPLPVWACSCGKQLVIGSVRELREQATGKLPPDLDLHKDVVDAITLRCSCGKPMVRVPDVMDVWFDSGIAPWASLGYPFRNKELFERLWPVDLVDESQDQTRGWFYTLMMCSQAVWSRPPYRTVCLNGWTLDEKGEKMSKSLGNVVWADDALKQLGADILRLYYCSDAPPWETRAFSLARAKELATVMNVLWNTCLFVRTYAADEVVPAALQPEDQWILSRVHSLTKSVTSHLDSFEFHLAGRELIDFILNDLSRWYIKLVRDRVSPSETGPNKAAAQHTLRAALQRTVTLLAPITPFLAESIWLSLFGRESVHLEPWPAADDSLIRPGLERSMGMAKAAVEAVNAARQQQKIKLRWPLDEVTIQTADGSWLEETAAVVTSMGNAKTIRRGEVAGAGHDFAGGKLAIGNVLKDEALLRELIRAVQEMRKAAGLEVADKIQLFLQADQPSELILKRFEKELRSGTGSSRVTFGKMKTKRGAFEFEGRKVEVGF